MEVLILGSGDMSVLTIQTMVKWHGVSTRFQETLMKDLRIQQWKWLLKLGKELNGGNMVAVEPYGTQWLMILTSIFSTLALAMLPHGTIRLEARVGVITYLCLQ